jgi:beta-galactosidase/beta-glucuronidase
VHDEQTGQWLLNGERVFLRGMRYISSQWMSEANEAMWSEDLAKMLDMQINSIRIGSHVERTASTRCATRWGSSSGRCSRSTTA